MSATAPLNTGVALHETPCLQEVTVSYLRQNMMREIIIIKHILHEVMSMVN